MKGYIIYTVKQKLKQEFVGLPGEEIKKLKLSGVEVGLLLLHSLSCLQYYGTLGYKQQKLFIFWSNYWSVVLTVELFLSLLWIACYLTIINYMFYAKEENFFSVVLTCKTNDKPIDLRSLWFDLLTICLNSVWSDASYHCRKHSALWFNNFLYSSFKFKIIGGRILFYFRPVPWEFLSCFLLNIFESIKMSALCLLTDNIYYYNTWNCLYRRYYVRLYCW